VIKVNQRYATFIQWCTCSSQGHPGFEVTRIQK